MLNMHENIISILHTLFINLTFAAKVGFHFVSDEMNFIDD